MLRNKPRIRNKAYRTSAARIRALWKQPKPLQSPDDRTQLSMLVSDAMPALKQTENDEDYGVRSEGRENARDTALRSLRNNFRRWVQSGARKKGIPFIEFMSDRYAPIGAENDETYQNVNWAPNMTSNIAKRGHEDYYVDEGILAGKARRRALYRKVDNKGNYLADSLGSESEGMYSS